MFYRCCSSFIFVYVCFTGVRLRVKECESLQVHSSMTFCIICIFIRSTCHHLVRAMLRTPQISFGFVMNANSRCQPSASPNWRMRAIVTLPNTMHTYHVIGFTVCTNKLLLSLLPLTYHGPIGVGNVLAVEPGQPPSAMDVTDQLALRRTWATAPKFPKEQIRILQ